MKLRCESRIRVCLALALSCLLDCGSKASSNQPSHGCPTGTESCSCTTGGVCDPGLECLSNLCVSTGGTGGAAGDPDAAVQPHDGALDSPVQGPESSTFDQIDMSIADRFTNHGDGTVTDLATSLMWQKDFGGKRVFAGAWVYCDDLSLGGYTDWRLPQIEELRTLIVGCPATTAGGSCPADSKCGPAQADCLNDSCEGCAVGGGLGPSGCYLPPIFDVSCEWYWADTTAPWGSTQGFKFFVHFDTSYTNVGDIGNELGFRCVRTGP